MDGGPVEVAPKTEAGRRSIGLPAQSIAALRKWRAQQAEERLLAGPLWEDAEEHIVKLPSDRTPSPFQVRAEFIKWLPAGYRPDHPRS